ncbi:transcription factor jumonji (jmjC) domain-containing protein [Actinidia rufa]|uniref:Transcription factor jumonji (JmjC) domain-containing protein n=1 Tax=Actinidia rufa TaxID=165716 RepID=A0A7J0E8F6_9ERIC|nr:transcription factor jumonji (jmjC) domain-containing protein [Actinidia rufa]
MKVPPDNLRCERNDGKQWRCSGWRMQETKMCEKHYLQAQERSSGRKKSIGSRVSEGGRGSSSKISNSATNKKRKSRTREDPEEDEVIPTKNRRGKVISAKEEDDEEEIHGGDEKDDEEENEKEANSVKRSKKYSNVKKLGTEDKKFGVSTKSKQKEDINGEDDSESANLSKRTKKPLRPKQQQQQKDKVSSVKGVEKNDRIESASDGRKKKKKKDKDLKPKNEEEVEDKDDPDHPKDKVYTRRSASKQNSLRVDSRRRHFSTDGGEDDCQMCHQCQRSDRRVVRCRKGCRKRFCGPCIERWYPLLSEDAIAEFCPYCRGNCNCKACLRRQDLCKINKYTGEPESEEDKIRHLKYLVYLLHPYLKQFDHDQIIEKEMEAKIKGLSPSDIEVQKAVCDDYERAYCDYCRTSIVDFHRSCPKCSFDVCLTCCREVREGCQQVGNDIGGKSLILPSDRNNTSNSCIESNSEDDKMPKPVWSAKETGDIPCPPVEMGGCGHDQLELKCMFPENWTSELKKKVEKSVESHIFANVPGISKALCCCFKLNGEVDVGNGNLRKAASRKEADDNYLYCPSSSDIQQGNLEHFQRHWVMGEPVIVRNVLESTSGLSWEPMVMWRAFREITYTGSSDLTVTAVDCLDWCEHGIMKCDPPAMKPHDL